MPLVLSGLGQSTIHISPLFMRDFLPEGRHIDSDQESGGRDGEAAGQVRLHGGSLPLEKTGDGGSFEWSKRHAWVKLQPALETQSLLQT